MDFRIGFGYDVHRLAEGYNLMLGGIKIPHSKGSVGHSDADVLIHVICDALLGAANMRDIGYHFPDSDPRYKDIDSKKLLKEVIKRIKGKGYSIGNIDTTVCLQNPKIQSYIPEMITSLAKVMDADEENISIKATTTEKMGFIGREEGLEAYAVALIYKS